MHTDPIAAALIRLAEAETAYEEALEERDAAIEALAELGRDLRAPADAWRALEQPG